MEFEIFGIKIWGKEKKKEKEIIDKKKYRVDVKKNGDRKNEEGKEEEMK